MKQNDAYFEFGAKVPENFYSYYIRPFLWLNLFLLILSIGVIAGYTYQTQTYLFPHGDTSGRVIFAGISVVINGIFFWKRFKKFHRFYNRTKENVGGLQTLSVGAITGLTFEYTGKTAATYLLNGCTEQVFEMLKLCGWLIFLSIFLYVAFAFILIQKAETEKKQEEAKELAKTKLGGQEIVVVTDITEKELKAYIAEICSVTNTKKDHLVITVHPIHDKVYALTFPNGITFESFCIFLNALIYPASGNRTIQAKAWGSIEIPENKSMREVMFYIPQNDTEYDTIFCITSDSETYKIKFDSITPKPHPQIEEYRNCPLNYKEVVQTEGFIVK